MGEGDDGRQLDLRASRSLPLSTAFMPASLGEEAILLEISLEELQEEVVVVVELTRFMVILFWNVTVCWW